MGKIKVGRSDIIKIAKEKHTLLGGSYNEKISYKKWIEFIENHKDYFMWYEDTEDGKNALKNIDKVPEWAKTGLAYRLNKTNVYSTNKIVKQSFDLILRYFDDEGIVKIDIEKKMSKEIAEILLRMAEYLNGKLIINGTKELLSVEQLD
jgi:hypothetical protein